jgi:hypothetical protein
MKEDVVLECPFSTPMAANDVSGGDVWAGTQKHVQESTYKGESQDWSYDTATLW